MNHQDIKDIAKQVKQELNKAYPACKWSVGIKRFSGGQELNISLLSAPFKAFARDKTSNGYPQNPHTSLNQYQFHDTNNDEYLNNGAYLTKEAWDCMAKAYQIANRENWDNSDIQTDYFDVNYYLNLEIGRWDKPFVNTEIKILEAVS